MCNVGGNQNGTGLALHWSQLVGGTGSFYRSV